MRIKGLPSTPLVSPSSKAALTKPSLAAEILPLSAKLVALFCKRCRLFELFA
ncbi:hypothetical protein VQ056_21590 [Paenibacillus sp. JTLBN-2024]